MTVASPATLSNARIVLDASALLCLLQDETGADIVRRHLAGAVIGAVNYGEVIAKLDERRVPAATILAALADLGLDVAPHDRMQAEAAGLLRSATRAAGLSLGDRACLALARTLIVPALTTDREWATLDLGIEVILVR